MAYYGYMQHDDPAPPIARLWYQRVQACGYAGSGMGENIAYGYPTPQDVMNGWLNSPGHKANIENASYRAIGVGARRLDRLLGPGLRHDRRLRHGDPAVRHDRAERAGPADGHRRVDEPGQPDLGRGYRQRRRDRLPRVPRRHAGRDDGRHVVLEHRSRGRDDI